jgi:hypothetical protein
MDWNQVEGNWKQVKGKIKAPAKGEPLALDLLPQWAGHLSFDNKTLLASRLASKSNHLGARSGDVVRYLLRDQIEKLALNSGEPTQ